jgi:hypothetical protein
MKTKILLITGAMILAIFIAGIVFAGGPGGGGMGGGGMGGGGMMGGGHMMNYGKGYAAPFQDQYNRSNESSQYSNREIEGLRYEIRGKREELSDLYRDDKPDKELIDQKIKELSRLEAELDQKTLAR